MARPYINPNILLHQKYTHSTKPRGDAADLAKSQRPNSITISGSETNPNGASAATDAARAATNVTEADAPAPTPAAGGGGTDEPPTITPGGGYCDPDDEAHDTGMNADGQRGATGAGNGVLARVGRWMSRVEHDAMVQSGVVQEGTGGTTYVANPADPAAYGRQAASGTGYVEFDVPRSCLYPAGEPGWAQIPGPNSLQARLAARRGLPAPEFPTVSNIQWLLEK